MPNTPIPDHRWLGKRFTYRPDLPVYDMSNDDKTEGVTVVAPGMHVVVKDAFANWNDQPGLDMLYVHVPETGLSTHVTPADLGLSQPVECDGLPLDQTTCPDRAGHM